MAAIISLRDFNERFVERAAQEEKLLLIRKMDKIAMVSKDATSSEDILRELRGARSS